MRTASERGSIMLITPSTGIAQLRVLRSSDIGMSSHRRKNVSDVVQQVFSVGYRVERCHVGSYSGV